MSDHAQLGAEVLRAPAYRLFAALWGGLALVDVARAAHASAPVQVAVLVLLVAGCALGQGTRTALVVAGIVWLVATGFVIHTGGQLAWTGAGDVARLALFALTALAAAEVRR